MVTKFLVALSFACGVLLAGAAWLLWPEPRDDLSAAAAMDALMWGREPVGGPFALIDHTGKVRTDTDFRGKLLLIYFGFTFCSDVCPTDLQAIASAMDKLGTAGDAVQPLFITVDPEKDTPGQLAGYVSLIHPRLIGLTGDARQIRKVARAYKVYNAKVGTSDSLGYAIDHAGVVYLLDADGSYAGFFPSGTSAERMVEVIRAYMTPPTQR
jgi:protein SCO1